MEAKEKALELVNRFMYIDKGITKMHITAAKECALIAVDEIMEAYPTTVHHENLSSGKIEIHHCDNRDYWQSVKTEIETL